MKSLEVHLRLLQVSLVFIVTTFGGGGNSQSLQNSCSFNQFRCSDGSACLLSEKLCNGYEDCPGGEDENGNAQWDCSLTTLSTACSSEEFRCRFGGCIQKSSLCDGVADCWGATDESFDLCQKRPTRRPSLTPQKPSGGTINRVTMRPRPPIKVSQPSRKPVKITTTEPTEEPIEITQRPKPTPSPPMVSTKCELLKPKEGAEVSCILNNFPVKCTEEMSREGTSAIYKCKKYWDAPRTGSQSATQVCRNGKWSRLNRNWLCSLQCGIAGVAIAGFVVNGFDSIVGRWPWHVGLYQENPPNSGNFDFFCGGSLISRHAVLTAAHCVTRSQTSEKRTDPIKAILGKFNRTYENDDAFVQKRDVVDIAFPEYYSPKFYEEDIAIVWLDKEAEISERVRPVCLPTEEDELEAGVLGTLMGWGRWVDRSYPEKLQMAYLPVVNTGECRRSHSSLAALSRPTTFCAGYKNGTSACDGDSGGGLVFEDSRRYMVQGVVSAGINSYGLGGGCDPQHYTVFTKVNKFRNWIDNILDSKEESRLGI